MRLVKHTQALELHVDHKRALKLYELHDSRTKSIVAPVDALIEEPARRDRWSEEHDLFDIEQATFFPTRRKH